MTPETLPVILNGLVDESLHFLLAFSMGGLVFALTSTTWFVITSALGFLTHRRVNSAVDYGILISCLLLGLSAALLSHWVLDYFARWYITPLGPGLELIK